MKIWSIPLVLALASTGCYSHLHETYESMAGSYHNRDTSVAGVRIRVPHFDGREAFFTCVRLMNQQAYIAIQQAALARQMGVGAFYVTIPQNVVQACMDRTSGPMGSGMMNNGGSAMMAAGFAGGSFDAGRMPMMMATAPTVQVVPVQTGTSLPADSAASNGSGPSTDVLDHRVGVIYREVRRQGQAIARIQSRR